METNALYYGDNLNILRTYVPDESVDLVYLDPPFSSNRDYNVIFRDESGQKSDAQLLAFEDTWHWGPGVESVYSFLTNTSLHRGRVPEAVAAIIGAFRQGLGTNQMTAYLVEMAVRLVELHRVLKPTGSIYLHCDPTASHHLKLLLDAIFGPTRFRTEIIWKRSSAHSDTRQGRRQHGRIHDVILFYTKGDEWTWNPVYTPYDPEYASQFYPKVDAAGRRFGTWDITGPGGAAKGNPSYDVMGVTRFWRYSRESMDRKIAEGRIVQSSPGTVPREIRYLDEMPGVPLQDVWTDIPPVAAQARERLGWDTQKPLALLERIIESSSNPGDLVLDPFCGCGTATVAAHRLGRRWVGIDVTHLSIAVMRARLRDSFPELSEVKVIGQPNEVEGARMLAAQSLEGRYEFQYWALSLIDAQPVGDRKKGADSGIDGRITFTDAGGAVRPVLVSVKSGHVNVAQVRDLIGTMQRENAPLGVFLTLEEPSKPMLVEAAGAGVFYSEVSKREYPRVQIFTIRELLDGRRPSLPLLVLPTYQQAERVEKKAAEQQELFG